MDVFEQLLTSGSRGSVSPETLEYIGQRASNEFLEKKASLNASIVKLAAQHPELNNEHIHRIAEFANNSTFQHLFEKNHDKNVHFDIADPGVIIRDLRDGGSPAHSGKVLHNKQDYFRPPISEKDSDGSGDSALPHDGMTNMLTSQDVSGEFGQGEPIQKVASAGLDPSWEGSANPVNDVYAEHLRLERSRDEISAAHEAADLMYKRAKVDFHRAVKNEVLSEDGAGLSGVVAAVQKIASSVPAVRHELASAVESLISNGVSSTLLEQQNAKVASARLLNMDHPLAVSLSGLVKCAQEKMITGQAVEDLEKALEKTHDFLKTAGRK